MRICTRDGCNNEAIFDTNICDDCLEGTAIKALENFGTPDCFLCGHCGRVIQSEDSVEHVKKHLANKIY